MSSDKQKFFAMVRSEECDALMKLKPTTAKLWIAIRCGRNELKPFGAGSRDFKEQWGLGRDAVASGLKELVAAGLLIRIRKGSFTRGSRHTFQIVHTRTGTKNRVGKSANPKPNTAGSTGTIGRKTRQVEHYTVGSSGPPKDTSSTSSRKSEEEEVSVVLKKEAEREVNVQAQQKRALRSERVAQALRVTDTAFLRLAGGPKTADALAIKFELGELSLQQLRACLSKSDAELGKMEIDDGEVLEPQKTVKQAKSV